MRGRPRGRLGPSGWGLGGWMRGRPRLRLRISAPGATTGGWSGSGGAGAGSVVDVVDGIGRRRWGFLCLWEWKGKKWEEKVGEKKAKKKGGNGGKREKTNGRKVKWKAGQCEREPENAALHREHQREVQ